MSRLILSYVSLLMVLVLISSTGVQCKHETASSTPRFRGKYVYDGACEHFLVQVLSGPLDSSFVMKAYKEPNNKDSTYTNVFGVSDYCGYFGMIGIKVGDEFLFNFGSPFKTTRPTCNGCEIVGPLPPVNQDVKDVQILRGKD